MLASQPSVSMETETTQRMSPPRVPGLPTVFMTSRSNSWSDRFSASRAFPVRSTISRLNRSISSAAIARKLLSNALPVSSCSLSIRSVLGCARGFPLASKFRNKGRRPISGVVEPSAVSRTKPET